MKGALAFRDDEALRVAIMSGLAPADVQAKTAKVVRDAKGTLYLAPSATLSPAVLKALQTHGVELVDDAKLPDGAREVSCWSEAVALTKTPVTQTPSLVLLTSPDREGIINLAAELLRLGCERQELIVTPNGGVLRCVDPPTYTVVRAIDRERGLRGFAPDPHGQETVWTELGYKHPLAGRLKAEKNHLLLVAADGWRHILDDGWKNLDHALELGVTGSGVEHAAVSLGARRKVELRFAPGRREAPSLWVIRRGGTAAIDKLLEYLPEEVVTRLTFAAAGRNASMLSVPGMKLDDIAEGAIIIRARTGRHGPPDLSLDAEEYAPLVHMPDVYAPAGAIVEPPLRRERLRSILGIEQGQVVWLAPMNQRAPGSLDPGARVHPAPSPPDPAMGFTSPPGVRGPFRVERILDSAFAPLSEWADYVIHASAPQLVPWQRAVVFDFAPFVSTGLEWASERPKEPERQDENDRERKKPKPTRGRPAPTPISVAPAPPPTPTAKAPKKMSR